MLECDLLKELQQRRPGTESEFAGPAADAAKLAAEGDAGQSPAECWEAQLRCQHCGHASLRPIAILARPTVPELVARTYARWLLDSS
jgi:hypothetical protein